MKCSGNSTNCTACDIDGGSTVYLSGSICIQTCPNKYYGVTSASGNTCSSCSDGCNKCYGIGFDKCTACTLNSTGTAFYK